MMATNRIVSRMMQVFVCKNVGSDVLCLRGKQDSAFEADERKWQQTQVLSSRL